VLKGAKTIKEVNEPFLWRKVVQEEVDRGLKRQEETITKVREVLVGNTNR